MWKLFSDCCPKSILLGESFLKLHFIYDLLNLEIWNPGLHPFNNISELLSLGSKVLFQRNQRFFLILCKLLKPCLMHLHNSKSFLHFKISKSFKLINFRLMSTGGSSELRNCLVHRGVILLSKARFSLSLKGSFVKRLHRLVHCNGLRLLLEVVRRLRISFKRESWGRDVSRGLFDGSEGTAGEAHYLIVAGTSCVGESPEVRLHN